MEITFANMYDPDIVDEDEARSVILYYEYSRQDSSKGIYHSWLNAEEISAVNSSFVCYFWIKCLIIDPYMQ